MNQRLARGPLHRVLRGPGRRGDTASGEAPSPGAKLRVSTLPPLPKTVFKMSYSDSVKELESSEKTVVRG